MIGVLWRLRETPNMSQPEMEHENDMSGNFLLLKESEWYQYLTEHENVTVIYERRRTLTKLTNLEAGFCFLYALLFVAGVVSNGWAFNVVSTVLVRGGRQVNMLAYIGTLSLVNLTLLAFSPVTIIDIVAGEWLFPSSLCPMYWAVETLNKMLSPLILACLTVACYCAVCRPKMVRMYRSAAVATVHIIAVAAIGAWKSKPFVEHSSTFHLVDMVNETTAIHYGEKCLFHPPDDARLVKSITLDGFLSVYLLPMLYMIAFYSAILYTIMSQARIIGRRSPPRHFWKAARSAALLVSFYFCCWTPYWSVTLAMVLETGQPSDEEDIWSVAAFAAHLLPVVNCAFSPLLYTLTNRHVRTLYKTATAVREQRLRLRCKTSSSNLL